MPFWAIQIIEKVVSSSRQNSKSRKAEDNQVNKCVFEEKPTEGFGEE